MLKDKTILVGVTGSIASYKAATLVSMLVKTGAEVRVLMTKNATNIINPITFETLSGHKCFIDTFDRNFEFKVSHVSLAQKADIFLIIKGARTYAVSRAAPFPQSCWSEQMLLPTERVAKWLFQLKPKLVIRSYMLFKTT